MVKIFWLENIVDFVPVRSVMRGLTGTICFNAAGSELSLGAGIAGQLGQTWIVDKRMTGLISGKG